MKAVVLNYMRHKRREIDVTPEVWKYAVVLEVQEQQESQQRCDIFRRQWVRSGSKVNMLKTSK